MDNAKELASITPKKREQLHVSGINMLNDCGLRFYFRYVLGIRRPPAAYMHIGTAVDESVARDLENKINTGELLKRDDAIGIAAAKFEERQSSDPIELEPDDKGLSIEDVIGASKDKTVALAGLHYDKAAPTIQPKHVQRKFAINMDKWMRDRAKKMHDDADMEPNKYLATQLHSEARALNATARLGLDLAGEQDIVELAGEQLVVRDTKTTGKSPIPTAAVDSDQLTIYALASLVLDKKIPDFVGLDFLIYTPKRHDTKYVYLNSTRTMEDLEVGLYRFSNAIHAYRRGVFVPAKADWYGCSQKYCGYFDRCPAAKRPKLVQITQEYQGGETK